eukprot:CAMPEP_0179281176 /NCGR_PEP_ID=MMETSP0797-20121207/37017_1 /TAXON_ID=47934 /ORGANISM="Dinophysis acuminata, Strain DAEP01" /LENGTH=139 /DNA_ID=CAMNT_0020989873 /DNA_START=231 /DNA_END=647 /DNA_ORIENTATION=-
MSCDTLRLPGVMGHGKPFHSMKPKSHGKLNSVGSHSSPTKTLRRNHAARISSSNLPPVIGTFEMPLLVTLTVSPRAKERGCRSSVLIGVPSPPQSSHVRSREFPETVPKIAAQSSAAVAIVPPGRACAGSSLTNRRPMR